MKSKGESISNLIFGGVFLAVGGLLLSMRSEMIIVKAIAIADLVLGIVLFVSGIIGMRKNPSVQENNEPETEAQPQEDMDWSRDFTPAAAPSKKQPRYDEEQPDRDEGISSAAEVGSLEALTARENELRKIVKRKRAEARQAAAEADDASARASAAEQELVNAERELKELHGIDQQAALARVDKLADRAMDLSQQAAVAARKAKMADRAYKQAAQEHNEAVDAAAEALIAAEDAGWNN